MASHRVEEPETDMPQDLSDEMNRQHSARNDPAMRDGNSGHGNPYEYPPDEESSDRDVGDTGEEPDVATEEAGVLDAVPANQAGRQPDADPPVHAGMAATREVDDLIDARGTAESPDTGRGTEDGAEFAATVGDNTPAELEAEMSPDDEAPSDKDTPASPRADSDTRGARGPFPGAVSEETARRANRQQGKSAEAEGAADLPIEDYHHLTVKEVVQKLGDLSPDQLRRVKEYEQSHRNRKTLLGQLERRLQENGSHKRSDTKEPTRSAPGTSGGQPNP